MPVWNDGAEGHVHQILEVLKDLKDMDRSIPRVNGIHDLPLGKLVWAYGWL